MLSTTAVKVPEHYFAENFSNGTTRTVCYVISAKPKSMSTTPNKPGTFNSLDKQKKHWDEYTLPQKKNNNNRETNQGLRLTQLFTVSTICCAVRSDKWWLFHLIQSRLFTLETRKERKFDRFLLISFNYASFDFPFANPTFSLCNGRSTVTTNYNTVHKYTQKRSKIWLAQHLFRVFLLLLLSFLFLFLRQWVSHLPRWIFKLGPFCILNSHAFWFIVFVF